MGTGEFNKAGGNHAIDYKHLIQGEGGGEEQKLSVVSCYRNQDKLPPDGPLGSYADLPYPTLPTIVT